MSTNQTGHVATKSGYLQAIRWIRCAWQLLQQTPSLWLGMAAIYLALGALLEAIPFAGHLLVALLSPMLLAGALYALPPHGDDAPAPGASAPERYLHTPARQLLQAFATEARIYPTVLMGIMVVGLVVVLAIAQYFVGTGSLTAEWAAARHGVVQTASAILRLVASGVLHAILFMALFYAVHRTVYARRDPMMAIADSFAACKQQASSLLMLALLFLLPYIVIGGAFQAAPWLGYVAVFSVGLVALPLLVLASYCSYRDIFGDAAHR